MANQSGSNVVVSYKVESAFNTAPGTGSAKQLRIKPSPGMSLDFAEVVSAEVRADQLDSMARLGSRKASGSYMLEASVGGFDDILEALMRSTWVAATTITQATASLTSVAAPTTSTLLAGSGSWVTAGVRAGDVLRMTGFATAANNNINLRVKSVTASTITLYGTPLTVDAAADTTFSITILKKLKNGASPTKRTFYIDEYEQDVDLSEVFGGCKFISLKVSGSPDGMANIEVGLLGASGTPLVSGSSPYYIAPTIPTGVPLVFSDASVSVAGLDVTNATAFEFTYTLAAKTEPVIGTSYTPDVFDNKATLSGSISFIRQDLSNVTALLAETEFDIHITLVAPMAEPKDCLVFYLPRLKRTKVDGSIGGDGAYIETVPFRGGAKDAATGVDATLLTISTSAP